MIPPRILDDNPTEAEARLLQATQKFRAPDKIRRTTLAAVSAVAGTGATAMTAETGARALWTRMGLTTKLLVGAVTASAFFAVQTPGATTESLAPELAPDRRGSASAERFSPSLEGAPATSAPAPLQAQFESVAEPASVHSDSACAEPRPSSVDSVEQRSTPAKTVHLARPVPRLATPRGTPSATAPEDAESLIAEIATIDRAKRALERKDADAALVTLDEHRRRFRTGALVPEATALRIEALIARGDAKTARRLAEAFLVDHPTSPLGPRIRDLAGAGSKAPGRTPGDSNSSP
jgi:hypothetical protein